MVWVGNIIRLPNYEMFLQADLTFLGLEDRKIYIEITDSR